MSEAGPGLHVIAAVQELLPQVRGGGVEIADGLLSQFSTCSNPACREGSASRAIDNLALVGTLYRPTLPVNMIQM